MYACRLSLNLSDSLTSAYHDLVTPSSPAYLWPCMAEGVTEYLMKAPIVS